MAYFIPLAVQKRLLRYALSKLELLDADQLDLEKLDIALGKKSTISLRDVEINLDKLTAILHLPRRIHLLQARILQLRIIIPADIYNTGIDIQIDGIDASAKLLREQHEDEVARGEKAGGGQENDVKTPGKTAKGKNERSDDRAGSSEHIPTAEYLAKSFLHDVKIEGNELQNALKSQPQLPQESNNLDESEDTALDIGTGTALSMPRFLTSFLQGISDRLRIAIENVQFTLQAAVELNRVSNVERREVPLSIVIGIRNIALSASSGNSSQVMRTVRISGISGSLACDVDILTSLSLISSPISPSFTSSPESSIRRVNLESEQCADGKARSEPARNPENLSQSMKSLDTCFPSANTNPLLGLSSSRQADHVDSSVLTDEIERFADADKDEYMQHKSDEMRIKYRLAGGSEIASSEINNMKGEPACRIISEQNLSRSSVRLRAKVDSSTSGSSANNEDLSRSTIFTHEEAASMYYSVSSNINSEDEKKIPDARRIGESRQKEELMEADQSGRLRSLAIGSTHDNDCVKGPKKTRTAAHREIPSSDNEHQIFEHHTTKLLISADTATIILMSPSEESTPDENHSSQYEQSEMDARYSRNELDIPGAFSQYAEAGVRRCKQGYTAQPNRLRKQVSDAKHGKEPVDDVGDRVNPLRRARRVNIGSISVDTDMLRGRLLYEVLNQILSSIQSGTVPDNTKKPHIPSEITMSTEINVDSVVLRILGEAANLALDADNESEGKGLKSDCSTGNLLKLTVTKINVLSQLVGDAHQLDLNVLDLRFGFEEEDILSFDAKARMRTSVRDLKEPQSSALTCSILTSEQHIATHISTLPVLLSLDVHKINDFLEACGGVGSIIELGTSINSNSTIQRISQAERHRLDNNNFNEKQSNEYGLTAQVKCNARIAGSLITLRTRSCLMKTRTSAVKIIYRQENIAVQIDEIDITAPQAGTAFESDHSLLQLKNNRVQFLSAPGEDDLGQLVALVAPSMEGYEDNDDVLLDTLLAQRKKGSSLRITTSILKFNLPQLRSFELYQSLSEELARLTAVKKYLPEESRPGMLILVSVDHVDVVSEKLDKVGSISLQCQKICTVYTAVPILLALSIGDIVAKYQINTELVHKMSGSSGPNDVPMVLACFVGDDLEMSLKIKLNNFCCEYDVPAAIAFAKLMEDNSLKEPFPNKGTSTATVTENSSRNSFARFASCDSTASSMIQPLRLKIFLQNCALGLNPSAIRSKGLFVFTNAKFSMTPEGNNITSNLDLRKASLLVIDEVSRIKDDASVAWTRKDEADGGGKHVERLRNLGYVCVSTISSANASVKITNHGELAAVQRSINVDLKDELFIIETCADSTQTTLEILNGLRLPSKPNKDAQFRTEVMPMQDIMASFSGDAFAEPDNGNSQELIDPLGDSMLGDGETVEDLNYIESLYNFETIPFPEDVDQEVLDSDLESTASSDTAHMSTQKSKAHISTGSGGEETKNLNLDFEENYFSAQYSGLRGRREGGASEDGSANETKLEYLRSPLTMNLRDVHVIWNLFDGYDWPATQNTIATAVNDLEIKAEERRREREKYRESEEDQPVIGDYLFNSIWIDIPPNKNPYDLSAQISRDVNDRASETDSYTTSVVPYSPSKPPKAKSRFRRLKLARGRHHKITFELRGVSANVVVFPPGVNEMQSSISISITDFEVFDHVPSSTWKKFATCMHDAGEREMGKPMVRFEIRNVKPVPELAASELVLRASILPLRLHVDQDALDFIIRFFEFTNKTESETVKEQEKVFLQRVEIEKIIIKLDYKPKKVDYTGLHSGHTTELMNFFILDGSDIVLRHAILYGISGFDKLHKTLNDIWMPDVKRNQLPGVLAGLAPVRSLVNVGGGVRDLVVIPMREYRKDGRIVRSIRKGALAFARTTTSELARFGAKLAIGTQNVLQGTEDILANPTERTSSGRDWELETDEYGNPASDALKSPLPPPSTQSLSPPPSSGPNPVRAVSNYADQPIGVLAGMRGAARSLERDLLTARDAVIAIQGEVMESNSAGAAAKAVARRAPTVVLRPAIGASRAVGMTLLGAGNALDKDSQRRIEDKYKRV